MQLHTRGQWRKPLTSQSEERRAGWLFVLPNVLGYFVFWLFPVGFSLVLSFTQWNFISGFSGIRWVGLRNFLELASDQWFTAAFWNTLVYTGVLVPVSIGLGLVLAVVINEGVHLKSTLRSAFFLPYVTNLVAISAVWLVLFHPTRGPINQFLTVIGIENPPGWIASPDWSLTAVIIVSVWLSVGYQMLIYTAGLQAVPRSLYESADLDGATPIQKFVWITIPMLKSTTFFLFVTGFIGSFKVFAQVRVMTNGGPGTSSTVLVHYIYRAGFEFYRMGYASSMAWVLFALIFAVTAVQWLRNKEDSV